jgi:iron complex transport system substrate-binding protein
MGKKKLLGRVLAITLMLSLIFSITACGTQQTALNSAASDATRNEIKEVTITDHLGREVSISGDVERIVSGYYISTSMLIALGLEDKLVGMEAQAKSRPIYSLAAPKVLDLPDVGTAKQFNLEGCLALKPDLVILPVKLKDSIETLEKSGIKVLAINPENMELLKEALMFVGKATGTEERAARLNNYYDDKLAAMAEINKGIKDRKTVYLAGNSALLSTASSKMYQNALIESAGGKNAASEINDTYWATISYEQLIAYNPDIIIIVPFAQYTKEDVLNDPKIQQLKAIKNRAVYKMPDKFEAWDSPVPSGILGTMWLTSILNEEQYPFDRFQADAAAFYKEFYQIEINTEEITK